METGERGRDEPRRTRRRPALPGVFLRLALALVLAVSSVACIEAILRVADGYPLTALALPERAPRPASPPPPPRSRVEIATDYARRLIERPDVKPKWFDVEPQPLAAAGAAPAAIWAPLTEAAHDASVELDFEHFKLQNANFVLERWGWFKSKFPGLVYVYDPGDGSSRPPYRFFPGTHTPFGLSVNAFGFRGREIDLDKPVRTIRIAFLGASTTIDTHGYPASYPELIEPWLALWATERGFDVAFEVINAGREGITSSDIRRIAIDEVLPLEPDLLVYYEGSNDFSLSTLVPAKAGSAPPEPAREEFAEIATGPEWLVRARAYSAIARRLGVARDRVTGGRLAEPRKPSTRIVWPRGVDETRPDPDDPRLPLQLPTIVANLDAIQAAAAARGATLVPSTFVWLAWDGMDLDPVRHRGIFDYLNSSLGAYRYADIRSAADFQNRVLRAYAAERGLPLNDLAARLPMDPDLFDDPIHMSYPGVRLKAWLVFQSLLPILEERILSGALPRPDQEPASATPPVLRTRTGILRLVDPPGRRVAAIALGDLSRSTLGSSLRIPDTGPAVLETSTRAFGYAYEGEVPPAARASGALLRIRTRLRVLRGSIGIGVTDRSGSWLRFSTARSARWQDFDLIVPARDREKLDEIVLSNGRGDGTASEAEIHSIVFEEIAPPEIEPLPGAPATAAAETAREPARTPEPRTPET